MTWNNRIVGYDLVVPEDVLANPANVRRHSGQQREAMRGALTELGWIAPIVVNTRTERLIDGHMRVEEAISEGAPVIPVVYVDLSEEEERLALAILDPIGAMARNDGDRLDELLASISTDNQALNDLMASLTYEEIDGAPTPTVTPKGPDQRIVLTFDNPDDYTEFCAGLSLVPGSGITDKLLRLVRNAL